MEHASSLQANEDLEPIKRDLDSFVIWLSDKSIPAFARTVSTLTRLTGRNESSNAELVRTILKDVSMTAQVLKVANSAFYNYSFRKTSTVSRAVMLVGFDAVRSICLSVKVVETFLKGVQREQLLREVALSFHTAVQARALACCRNDESPEEVFIAALLYRFGEIAFWCFCPDELAEQMEAALCKPGTLRSAAELSVLGFRLRDLTVKLSNEWSLSDLLKSALSGGLPKPRVRYIQIGSELALAVEEGWDSARLKRLIKGLSELLKQPVEKVLEMVQSNARKAVDIAISHGAPEAGERIPLPVEEVPEAKTPAPKPKESGMEEMGEGSEVMEGIAADPTLQLQILRELSATLAKGQDPNVLLSMVLEGILRGVGMDRAFFAVLGPDAQFLKVKNALGWVSKKTTKDLPSIPVSPRENLFSHVLKAQKILWIKPSVSAGLMTEEVRNLIGDPPFFVAPIVVNTRAIGLICADRKPSKRDLDQESFAGFHHFCTLAGLSLSVCLGGVTAR